MTYRITKKEESAHAKCFGSGVRYRLVLVSNRPDGSEDGISSDLTVDKATFDSFRVGDEVATLVAAVVTVEELVAANE